MYLLIILISLILFAYLSYRKPIFGIYAIIFCLPLYFLRFSIFGIPSTVLEAMIYILTVIFLFKKRDNCVKNGITAINFIKGVIKKLHEDAILFFGIILLFSGAIIATAISSDIRTSAGILKAWFFDPLIFFLIYISVVKEKKEIMRSLISLVLSGFLVSLMALFYFLVPQYAGTTYDGRLKAFYLSANHLAMYLAPAIIIIFNFLLCLARTPCAFSAGSASLSVCKPTKRFVWRMALSVIFIPFYLTYSYSAWLGVFGSLFFSLVANYWGNKKKLINAALILVILSGVIFSQANIAKFKNIVNFSYPSISSRIVIWQVAVDILKEKWVFGIGPGTFQDHYLKKQADYAPYPEWAVPQPHNIFLAFWLETGILGLAGFILMLFWFFKAGLASLMRRNNLRIVHKTAVASCLAIMLYILIHGFFDTTYWKNDLSLIFWLLFGIIYAARKTET